MSAPLTAKMLKRSCAALALVLLVASCHQEIAIPVDPPTARKDYAQTPVNTPVVLTPLQNDHDPTGEVLSVLSIGSAAHGVAVLNGNGTVTYTPDTGYTGGDEFTVTIADASGNEVTESAYVSVGSSLRIAYMSNYEDYFTTQFYMSDLNLPGVAIPINQYFRLTKGPAPSESNVEIYSLSPDRTRAVFLADDSDDSNARNLFVVDLDQLGVVTQITDLGVGQGTSAVVAPLITYDNAYVLYLSNEFNPALFELVKVEIANPANKVRVNPAMVTGQAIARFELTPDGTRVLYVMSDPTTGIQRLYSTQLATPGVATQLSGTPTPNTIGVIEFSNTGGVGFGFIPGGTELLYPATENGATVTELWKVDWLNPAAPVKISGTASAFGVLSYQLTNDGNNVVYGSFELDSTQQELFLAPLATPAPAVRLNAPQTGEFSIVSYGVGQDSTFVVYLSDLLTNNVRELFKVDFANPGVAVRLNAPLPTGQDADVLTLALSVASPRALMYTIAPDKLKPTEQQIYLMDVDTPEVVTAMGAPVANSGTLLPIFSPDGQYALFLADPKRNQASAMYAIPLADPSVTIKMTPEQYPGAAAQSIVFLP